MNKNELSIQAEDTCRLATLRAAALLATSTEETFDRFSSNHIEDERDQLDWVTQRLNDEIMARKELGAPG